LSPDPQPLATTAAGTGRRHTRRDAWLILLLGLAIGLAFQGSRHLYDPDEGRYTDVAHEMVDLNDWLVPRLDPERPHFTKPPLTYWTIGVSFNLLGRNEWAARAPNAIAFALTGLLVFGIARLLGLLNPVLAAGIWLTMWGPVLAANIVTTDTLLVLFETLAAFGFVASGLVTQDAAPRRAGLRWMWAAFGLAFLTKGPPGLLPLAAIVVFVIWRRRRHVAALFDPLGIIAFVVIGLAWYVTLIWHSPDLLRYFVLHETVGRVASGEHHRNPGWFGWLAVYPPTLLIGSLPWAATAVFAARVRRGKTMLPLPPDIRRFLALWLALPLAIFILAQSRLPLYVLPLFVPLALAFAAVASPVLARGRTAVVALAVASALAIALKGGGSLLHGEGDAHRLALELRQAADLSTVDEVAFVDIPARYGLKHYLHLDVEQIESHPGALGSEGYSAPESLCHELHMPERVLLVTPLRKLDELVPYFADCDRRIEQVGTLRRWALFRSVPEPAVPR
jgi:4-amino-4-deoxy-L-arabinose transferase-like glycosyltransferase